MVDWNSNEAIACCGLICAACEASIQGCVGCHQGGGDPCVVRDCCLAKGLQGCWECGDFPCTRGPYANEEWAGLCIGLIQAIQRQSLEKLRDRVRARLGEIIDYGALRGLSAAEVLSMLDAETP